MEKADESLPISKEEYLKAKLKFYQGVKDIQKAIEEDVARYKAKEKNL